MIKILQEITDWGDQPVANGIYHVNDAGQLVAYQAPKGDLKTFINPMKRFSQSHRKFETIGTIDEPKESNVITVKGSKGNEYTIDDGQCSCPGFTYRGNCKHIDQVA